MLSRALSRALSRRLTRAVARAGGHGRGAFLRWAARLLLAGLGAVRGAAPGGDHRAPAQEEHQLPRAGPAPPPSPETTEIFSQNKPDPWPHPPLLVDCVPPPVLLLRCRLSGSRAHIPSCLICLWHAQITGENEALIKFPDPGNLEGVKSRLKPIAKLTNVAFSYDGGARDVLHAVSTKLCMASRVALIGANGAGKTTLLKLLVGELDMADGGRGDLFKHPQPARRVHCAALDAPPRGEPLAEPRHLHPAPLLQGAPPLSRISLSPPPPPPLVLSGHAASLSPY